MLRQILKITWVISIAATCAQATIPTPATLCRATLESFGSPRLNYDFIGYLPAVNRGEIRALAVGKRYYLIKTYAMGWDATVESMLEEHVPYLQFAFADEVENLLKHDVQLVLESFRSRRGFNAGRLKWILESERTLPRERMVHFKIRTREDLTEEYVRLFDATHAPDAPSAEKENAKAPFERHLKRFVPPERARAVKEKRTIAIVELGRAYKWGLEEDSPSETFRDTLAEIATYLDQRYLSRGIEAAVYVHTDEVGAKKLFPKLGFTIEQTPEQLGEKDEYLMRAEGAGLVRQFGSRVRLWKHLWSTNERKHLAFELYDAPRDAGPRTHPMLRPTRSMCPRFGAVWEYSHNPDSYAPELLADRRDLALYTIRTSHILQRPLEDAAKWSRLLLKSRDLGF